MLAKKVDKWQKMLMILLLSIGFTIPFGLLGYQIWLFSTYPLTLALIFLTMTITLKFIDLHTPCKNLSCLDYLYQIEDWEE